MEENQFIFVDTKQITKEKLNEKEYLAEDNLHPSEKAWDLLVPLLVKEADIK